MPTKTDADRSKPEVILDLQLPPELTSPARARHALNPLEERFDQDTLFKLRLLVSELVTNSVRHASLGERDQIALRVLCEPGAVRVEVLDTGRGFPAPILVLAEGGWEYQHAQDRDWPGGWGLNMVESLADSWGIVRNDTTTVWFEMRVAGETPLLN